MERLKKRKKTQFELDLRARFLVGIWVGLLIGLVVGTTIGALVTRHNIVAWDIQETKNEIRITYEKMKLEQIKIDELIETLERWQMEIDEIWIYYGVNLSTRAMASDEGRPSKED